MEKRQLMENYRVDFSPEFGQAKNHSLTDEAHNKTREEAECRKAQFILELIRNNGFNKTGEKSHWLRDSISELFARAVEELKRKNGTGITSCHSLPLNNEVQDEFFRLVVEQISDKVKQLDCILTQTGKMATPDRVFKVSPELANLITNDDVRLIFDREFMSSSVTTDDAILKDLGVVEFSNLHLLECLACTDWLAAKSDKWMAELYIYLNSNNLDKTNLHPLKRLKTVRLEDGTQASPESVSIFFPMENQEEYSFANELRICSSKVLEYDNTERNAEQFLKNIGVKQPLADDVIETHIIPFFRSLKTTVETEQAEISINPDYLRFVMKAYTDHTKASPERPWRLLDEVKNNVLLRVNSSNGLKYNKPDEAYLSGLYSGNRILERLFAGIDGISFIHEEYLTGRVGKSAPGQTTAGQETVEQANSEQAAAKPEIAQPAVGLHSAMPQAAGLPANAELAIDGEIRAYKEFRRNAESWKIFLTAIGVENKPRVTAKKSEIYETSQSPDWIEGRQYIVWNEQVSPDIEKILESGSPTQINLLYKQIEKHAAEYSEKLTTKYTCKPKRGILECHGGTTKTKLGRLVEVMRVAL